MPIPIARTFAVGQHVEYAPYGFHDEAEGDDFAARIRAVVIADEGPDPITGRPHLWRYRIRTDTPHHAVEFTTSAWNLRPAAK